MGWRHATMAVVAAVVSLSAMAITGSARIDAPGAVPASGCRVGAVISTDAFTTTGFSQARTVGPNETAPAGAWVIADEYVPSTSVTGSPNCPPGGDSARLNVVALKLTPTTGSWQKADIQQLRLIRDNNCNGLFEDGLDTTMQTRPGSELRSEGGSTFYFGPQSSILSVMSPAGVRPTTCGSGAVGLMVVVEIGPNPTSGSMFGLSLEALAADIPGSPVSGRQVSSGFSSSRNPAGSSIRLQIVGGQGGGGTTPPPGGGGGSSVAQELKSYDTNGNDRLEDPEFLNAVDDWVDRELSDNAFFAAIDIWTQQQPISSASLTDGVARVQARMTSRGVRFSAPWAASLSVDVFGLDGRSIYSDTASGSTLGWNLQTPDGGPVANGVYLYRATLTTADGQIVRGDVRKLLVQR